MNDSLDRRTNLMAQDAFPVVYSTLSCEALVRVVLSRYAIAPVVQCHLWNHGLSDVYQVVTEDNRYILRVSHAHWRKRDEVLFELEFLEFLYRQQLPVAYPLHTQSGNLCIDIQAPEGTRYAALFSYAEGGVPIGDLNPAQSQRLGEVMAQMHHCGLGFASTVKRDDLDVAYLLDRNIEIISPFLNHRPQEQAYLLEVAESLRSQLQALPKKAPYWSVCWGDPHSGNVHFTKDGQLTLFDFDQCGFGWRAFDLAKFLQIALRSGISPPVRQAFVRGYQSTFPLDCIERDAVHGLTQVAHLWSWAISIDNQGRQGYCRLDDAFFTQRLNQLRQFRSTDWKLV